jgi:hypothetical protein
MALDLGWPRRIYTDMFLSGDWRPVDQHVLQSPDITIVRGLADEQDDTPPATCTFTLDDSDDAGNGDWNPYNPEGQWFGQLTRNVPVRLGLRVGEDEFTRTVGSGWGTSPANGAWSAFTAGGTVATSVASDTGRHSITSTNASAMTYLAGVDIRDVEVQTDVTLSDANLTGDAASMGIVLRGQDTSNFMSVALIVNPDETVDLWLLDTPSTFATGAIDLSPIYTYTGQTWTIKAQTEGRTLRGKAWPAGTPEPLEWQGTAAIGAPYGAGWVGVRSTVAVNNTDTKPLVFSYDNLAIRIPRFEGETTRLVPDADSTLKFRTTAVRASDITQRLSQGKSPVISSMRYAITAGAEVADIIAYWPMEEQSYATSIAAAVGGNPMQVLRGRLNAKFGSDSTFPGSLPLPAIGTTEFRAVVPTHTAVGEYTLRTLLNIPGGQDDTAIFVIELMFTGTASKWHVQLEQDGSLSVRVFGGLAGLLVDDTGNPVVTDVPMMLTFNVWQNGANISYILQYEELDNPNATVSEASGSVAGETLGTATRVGVIGGAPSLGFPGPDGTVVGHMVLSKVFAPDPAWDSFTGYDGEKLFDRLERIVVTENGQTPVAELYDVASADDSMGPQRPDTLLNLVRECAVTNHGLLFSPKGGRALSYRRLESLYDPVPLLTLDHSTGVLAPGFRPVNDDFNPRNDVTVQRRDGGSAQAVREDGPNNALDPGTADGAVGRYDTTYTVNCETDDQAAYSAGWLLHLGTTNEPRFPEIPVELSGEVLSGDAAAQGALLDCGPGDALEITNLTKWGIYEPSLNMVLGYVERFNTTFRHLLAFNAVPAGPYRTGVLDDGEIRLDLDSTITEDLDTTETAIDITTSDPFGTVWATTAGLPAEFPFDVMVGGERMTVTACVDLTLPAQRFTVTRSVNGVVKTHSSGARISLADPYYVAR